MATTHYNAADPTHLEAGWHVSWGALFAGLAIALGISALLTLLGAAIGISVADISDLNAIGLGFGIGATVWMVLTTLAATFAGATVAAVLAGDPDKRMGALHGLTVWALSTVLSLVLLSSGVGSAFNLAGNVLQTGASAVGAVVPGGGSGAGGGQGASGQQDGGLGAAFIASIQAAVKRQAVSVLSVPQAGVSESEVSSAISEVSASDLGRIASVLIDGDDERARDILSNVTGLSGQEIEVVIHDFRGRVEQVGDSQSVNQAQQWLAKQLDQAQQAAGRMASRVAGQQVSGTEAERAIQQLSADVLAQVAGHLVTGQTQQAKDVLVVQTNLDEREVNAIVDGVQQDVQQGISAARRQANEISDTIGSYLQAVAWSSFIAMLLGVAAGLAGGVVGARAAPVRDPEV